MHNCPAPYARSVPLAIPILRFYAMMRLLHRSLFSLALVLASFVLASAQGAIYTVQFKASPNRAEAEEEVRQLKAKNISAYIVKGDVPGKGVFYRVRAGVFSNREDAKRYGASLQQRGLVSEFFVTAYEKPADDVASRPPSASPPPPKTTAKTNQPAATPGESPAPTRPAPPNRPDSATPNNAPGAAPGPDSTTASRPVSVPRNNPPVNSVAANPETTPAANTPTRPATTPANNPGLSASVGEAPA